MPKNIAKSCHFITFFKMSSCGIETVTVDVINASAVPIGTPFPISASMIGMTLTDPA